MIGTAWRGGWRSSLFGELFEFGPGVTAPRPARQPGPRLAAAQLTLLRVWEVDRAGYPEHPVDVVRSLAPSACSIRVHRLSAAAWNSASPRSGRSNIQIGLDAVAASPR